MWPRNLSGKIDRNLLRNLPYSAYNNRFESQKNFVIFSEKNHTRRSVSYKILPT